jgi:hypothetical protein
MSLGPRLDALRGDHAGGARNDALRDSSEVEPEIEQGEAKPEHNGRFFELSAEEEAHRGQCERVADGNEKRGTETFEMMGSTPGWYGRKSYTA